MVEANKRLTMSSKDIGPTLNLEVVSGKYAIR